MPRSSTASAPLYSFDFRADPAKSGWTYTPSKNEGKLSFVESEGWYSDKGGTLAGPAINVTSNPYQFYRMTFRSKADGKGYYAVFFQDAAGKTLVDDIYASVYASKEWRDNEVLFRGREGAATFIINFISQKPMHIQDLVVTAVSVAEAGDWADRLYAALPPLDYQPPAERWKLLPKTMERLRAGGPLRVVMLGDSIINDTNNSNWDALVERRYPQAELHMNTSVRGSTGCWYYQNDEQFKSYVVDRKPELLIIGGISNGTRDGVDGISAIREVIRKIRERIGCELLLVSGPMAKDWRPYDAANPDAPLPAQEPPTLPDAEFYKQEEALAREMNVEFLDMYSPWHRYLGASGKPWEWFHRDMVHADDRGKQILARVLDAYFAPKK